MGRELRRVPLDFDWKLKEPWEGFLNPYFERQHKCPTCESGYSPTAQLYHDKWYGYVPFNPYETGSTPWKPSDQPILDFATRNITRSSRYNTNEHTIYTEATRLANMWNGQWCHHLGQSDVNALVAEGRLVELTHDFIDRKWIPTGKTPTAKEVNTWAVIDPMAHDSLNAWICVKAKCDSLGVDHICSTCGGESFIWNSEDDRILYEEWKPTPPPTGPGYQIWETVSEGSPVSPVFDTPEELAKWMTYNSSGVDVGTSYEQWMKFILGPGYSVSTVIKDGVITTGVQSL